MSDYPRSHVRKAAWLRFKSMLSDSRAKFFIDLLRGLYKIMVIKYLTQDLAHSKHPKCYLILL